jgi:hypothetical protein
VRREIGGPLHGSRVRAHWWVANHTQIPGHAGKSIRAFPQNDGSPITIRVDDARAAGDFFGASGNCASDPRFFAFILASRRGSIGWVRRPSST